MANSLPEETSAGKLTGVTVTLTGFGRTELTRLINQNSETSVYATSHPGLVVKTFDLECGKVDEVSYGPYLSFRGEVENFEDIQGIDILRSRVPAYYGSSIDNERKFAFIAMEYLSGENLLAWSQSAAAVDYPIEWVQQFRQALYETLSIVKLFHSYGIILIDFKPDNVIRLFSGEVRFVDLGAFFTPRHGRDTENYVYSATPDYAELIIDTSNVQTGLPLTQGSDIFSAGVALFELATGGSRLAIAPETAETMLSRASVYRFRDSQIKDVWRSYPHLQELLPLLETQLNERRILFSEFWHLLKSYLASEVADWESLPEEEHRQMLLATGTAFIADQLPDQLQWLANAIARATTLRSFRLKSVIELMELLADPVAETVRDDIACHNGVIQLARDLDPPVAFRQLLNLWEVRANPETNHWAICSPLVASELRTVAQFTFLKEICHDDGGHRFYQIVGDLEADDCDGEKLTLLRLAVDHRSWVGA
jgi:serine/threonine protein kinase